MSRHKSRIGVALKLRLKFDRLGNDVVTYGDNVGMSQLKGS